jgi:hypothetical protein
MAGRSKQGHPSALAAVREKHAQGNRRAKDDWQLYQSHREHLTAAIAALAPAESQRPQGPLVLLGAGNCNDVDVAALLPRFSAVHLVDIDGGALDRARARLGPELRARTHAHGGIELTGLLAQLEAPGARPTGEAAIAAGVAAITAAVPVRDAAVVVSCCLLSQLGWSLEEASGGDDALGMELRTAALTVHLRTLAALCRPGGAALVAADIVSSDHYPLDELEAEADLRALATQLIAGQDLVYTSANPLLLARLVRRDAVLKAAFSAPEVLPPWLWTGPFERTYLVYPQILRRM